jgi:hypothetical protein
VKPPPLTAVKMEEVEGDKRPPRTARLVRADADPDNLAAEAAATAAAVRRYSMIVGC